MAGDDDIVDSVLGRLRGYLKDGPEAYIGAKKRKKKHSIVPQPSPSTLANIETLLLSKLVELTPLETHQARKESYTIFKDNARDNHRWSFLFDEISFKLGTQYVVEDGTIKYRQLDKLIGAYDVCYHDDKIDWGATEDWDVPSTVNVCDKGLVMIAPAEGSNCLEGRLFFTPDSDNDEYCSEEESYATNNEITQENSCAIQDEGASNYDAEERNAENPSDADDGEDSDDITLTESEKMTALQEHAFIHFGTQSFNLDRTYKDASRHASGSEVDFGLTKHPINDDNYSNNNAGEHENKSSVTIFRVDENMAFAKGHKQKFASLENAFNVDLGGYAKMEIQNVLEQMQAYRGSWTSKSCPSDMNLAERVVHLIWEHWHEGSPPVLFVRKGDLQLLARHELYLPDPDYSDVCGVNVAREHLILARPQYE